MSILATALLEARGAYDRNFQRDALKMPKFGLIEAAKNSNLLSEANQRLLQESWNKPSVAIPVFDKNLPTAIDGTPDCTFGDHQNNTALVTPAFLEAYVQISMFDVEMDSNELGYAEAIARKIQDAEEALARKIETAFFNLLDTNKATAYNSGLVGAGARYPLVGDALQVQGATNQNNFFYDFPSILNSDDFDPDNLEVIASPELGGWTNRNGQQGAANNENLAAQYNSYDFRYSRFVTKTGATNAIATGFILPKNTIGYYARTGGSYAKNSTVGETLEWGTMYSERLGINLNVSRLESCGDASAITGNSLDTKAKKEQWEFGYSIALLTPYTGGLTNSSIKKFDFIN